MTPQTSTPRGWTAADIPLQLDKHVVVTGANSGLGLQTSLALARHGATVTMAARDPKRGADAVARVKELSGSDRVSLASLDLADLSSVRAFADAWTGPLDVLVNNAGIAGEQRRPGEATIQDLRTVLETNVIGAAAVIGAFTPLLEASAAPVVVNVSSAVGSLTLNTNPDSRWTMLAYPMSKAALNMLTVQYARAFPRWRINSATPGLTLTEFTGPLDAAPDIEQLRAAGMQVNTVEEGAEVIVRLASIGPDGPTGTFEGNDGPVPW